MFSECLPQNKYKPAKVSRRYERTCNTTVHIGEGYLKVHKLALILCKNFQPEVELHCGHRTVKFKVASLPASVQMLVDSHFGVELGLKSHLSVVR